MRWNLSLERYLNDSHYSSKRCTEVFRASPPTNKPLTWQPKHFPSHLSLLDTRLTHILLCLCHGSRHRPRFPQSQSCSTLKAKQGLWCKKKTQVDLHKHFQVWVLYTILCYVVLNICWANVEAYHPYKCLGVQCLWSSRRQYFSHDSLMSACTTALVAHHENTSNRKRHPWEHKPTRI